MAKRFWVNSNTEIGLVSITSTSLPIAIPCYLTRAERLEQASWLVTGELVLVQGELTDKAAVYAYQLQQLVRPPCGSGEGDEFLAGMQRSTEG
jgi:hypothetical protein